MRGGQDNVRSDDAGTAIAGVAAATPVQDHDDIGDELRASRAGPTKANAGAVKPKPNRQVSRMPNPRAGLAKTILQMKRI